MKMNVVASVSGLMLALRRAFVVLIDEAACVVTTGAPLTVFAVVKLRIEPVVMPAEFVACTS